MKRLRSGSLDRGLRWPKIRLSSLARFSFANAGQLPLRAWSSPGPLQNQFLSVRPKGYDPSVRVPVRETERSRRFYAPALYRERHRFSTFRARSLDPRFCVRRSVAPRPAAPNSWMRSIRLGGCRDLHQPISEMCSSLDRRAVVQPEQRDRSSFRLSSSPREANHSFYRVRHRDSRLCFCVRIQEKAEAASNPFCSSKLFQGPRN